MKAIIAFAASLVVNFGALGALDWSAHEAQVAPAGQVLVTQLPDPSELSMFANIDQRHSTTAL
jgi:hypothetical protein